MVSKTIIPFSTHEGSGLGNSVRDIEKICPNTELINAISFRGENVKDSRKINRISPIITFN